MKITHWKRTRFGQYQINNCYQLQVSSRAHNQSFRSYDLSILVSHHPAAWISCDRIRHRGERANGRWAYSNANKFEVSVYCQTSKETTSRCN